jgi:hypothetical protein
VTRRVVDPARPARTTPTTTAVTRLVFSMSAFPSPPTGPSPRLGRVLLICGVTIRHGIDKPPVPGMEIS